MTSSRIYLAELARIQKRLLGLFEQTLLPAGYRGDDGGLGAWSPTMDLMDTGQAFRLEAELPGLKEDEIDLSIEGRTLVLSGRVPPPGEEVGFLRMERSYGAFRRVLELDAPVDSEAVSARLRHGVLTVTIPKLADDGEGAGSDPSPRAVEVLKGEAGERQGPRTEPEGDAT
jgi:HSP20 family protein